MIKIFLALLISINILAQDKDPYKILNTVKQQFDTIEDYEVDVIIKVDVNFLKVPESKAKIFFKKPDKIKLKSEGFALIPKQGLNFSPAKLLNENYNAIYIRSDTLDNSAVDIIKVIPLSDSSKVILTTIWIDRGKYVVRKLETTTKQSGTLTVNLSYDNDLILPSQVKFSFNVSDMQFPNSITGDFDEGDKQVRGRGKKQMTGNVVLFYSNYKINKGLPDSLFSEETE